MKLKTANVLSTAKLTEEMKTLNSKDGRRDPKTAKTIILSTYPTMSKRLMSKDEKWFTWKEPATTRLNPPETPVLTPRKPKKVTKYIADEVDGDNVDFVDKCGLIAPDGNLVSYEFRHQPSSQWKFDVLIADEAQYVRKESGSYHNLLRLIDWKRLFCRTHLEKLNKVWYQKQQSLTPEALRDLLSTAINREWSSPGRYNTLVRRRFDEIRNGSRPSSDLVVLDDESSIASLQLFEFCIIDRVFGKTLINTTIKHPYGLNHRQTRLVLEAFDEFCKPVQERGPDWNPLKFPVTPQNSITEHFDRVNDSGKRKRSAINGDAMASKRTR
ncbi:hypothetical protein ACJ41O_002779 [Fusarium nematophilum]